MIDHWLSAKGLDAIQKSGGWPEWVANHLDRPYPHRLQNDACEGFRVFFRPGKDWRHWRYAHHLTDHEALCILRDHKRVWLGKKGLQVLSCGGGRWIIESPEGYLGDDGKWYPWNDAAAEAFGDYDEALIEAILAVGAEDTK